MSAIILSAILFSIITILLHGIPIVVVEASTACRAGPGCIPTIYSNYIPQYNDDEVFARPPQGWNASFWDRPPVGGSDLIISTNQTHAIIYDIDGERITYNSLTLAHRECECDDMYVPCIKIVYLAHAMMVKTLIIEAGGVLVVPPSVTLYADTIIVHPGAWLIGQYSNIVLNSDPNSDLKSSAIGTLYNFGWVTPSTSMMASALLMYPLHYATPYTVANLNIVGHLVNYGVLYFEVTRPYGSADGAAKRNMDYPHDTITLSVGNADLGRTGAWNGISLDTPWYTYSGPIINVGLYDNSVEPLPDLSFITSEDVNSQLLSPPRNISFYKYSTLYTCARVGGGCNAARSTRPNNNNNERAQPCQENKPLIDPNNSGGGGVDGDTPPAPGCTSSQTGGGSGFALIIQYGCNPNPQPVCPEFYTGTSCQTPSCPHLSSCSGHGSCTGTAPATPTCSCHAGWEGSLCNVPDCPGTPDCMSRGECITTTIVPECRCAEGWAGSNCTVGTCPGTPRECSGNGLCYTGSQSPICDCYPGWTGRSCNESTTPAGHSTTNNDMMVTSSTSGVSFSSNSATIITTASSITATTTTTRSQSASTTAYDKAATTTDPSSTSSSSSDHSVVLTSSAGGDESASTFIDVATSTTDASVASSSSSSLSSSTTSPSNPPHSSSSKCSPGLALVDACGGSSRGRCNETTSLCMCATGWAGRQCTIPDCPGLPDCSSRGTCNSTNHQNVYCMCASGWTGLSCSVLMDNICGDNNNCSSNGRCYIDSNDAPPYCLCDNNFIGAACQTPANYQDDGRNNQRAADPSDANSILSQTWFVPVIVCIGVLIAAVAVGIFLKIYTRRARAGADIEIEADQVN
eukprot:TRINITY_DN4399_c0_g1_i3.p1 TRINITY_DN4399_c0_g1~~TRINITY_DN4399_c0_g1_i3.p1  ORF type:complete len:893 (-),score=160.55 TRINITY_DN4399_c0_g1_i3:514-3087(-)